MSRPKTMLKHNKGKRKKEQVLETADDFLAAGVEHEEAAGKWRAGDAVKSLRFFGRAVEVYDHGLQKFPRSLDLAYNKARVQLEVVTHPLLVKKLEVPLETALEAALVSHRYASDLDPENADTLFNTAQLLTTIAENLASKSNYDPSAALSLLEESLTLQSQCLTVQAVKFEETETQHNALANSTAENGDTSVSNGDDYDAHSEDTQEAEDQWFSVIEPITKETLIDTLLAQLGTLATICNILSDSPEAQSPTLPWVEEFTRSNVVAKLSELGSDEEVLQIPEVKLAMAKFTSSILEAGFRRGTLDIQTYQRERSRAFDKPGATYDLLLADAESLIAFESAVSEVEPSADSGSGRWQALTSAIAKLAAAAQIKDIDVDEKAKTHYLRGNCSLQQHQLSLPPVEFLAAKENARQLLKNAEVFYRNASKLYQDEDEKNISALRSGLVAMLQTDDTAGTQALSKHPRGDTWARAQIQEMLDEGLLSNNFGL